MLKFILSEFIIWRLFLFAVASLAPYIIHPVEKFLGPFPWANFDGIHYLSIASSGYHIYQQAFFPLFPLLIHLLSYKENYLITAVIITHAAFLIALILFWKLLKLDYPDALVKKAITALLILPTSFFFASIYTESLFLMLILASFYAARTGRWWIAGITGFFAALTRFVGVFLFIALVLELYEQKKFKLKSLDFKMISSRIIWLSLIPVGLIFYMIYLYYTTGDPLGFIHVQPAFGAQRSGGAIIFLPQVIIRYVKIFLTVPVFNYNFWIALLEFSGFALALTVLIFLWKKVRKSYIIFSLLAILIPTLTGTFSSMPRYILTAFPIFISVIYIQNRFIQAILGLASIILLIILSMFFTQGYFVA